MNNLLVIDVGPPCYPTKTMFQCIIDNLGDGLGIGGTAATWIVGFVLCLVIIVALYKSTGSPLALPVGGFLGLAFVIGANIIPDWVFMIVVFLLIMIVAGMLFGGQSTGDE